MPDLETPVVPADTQAVTPPVQDNEPDITDVLREDTALESMLITKPRKPKKGKVEPKPAESVAEPAKPAEPTEPAKPVDTPAEPAKQVRVRKPSRQNDLTPAQIAQLAAEAASNVARQQPQPEPKSQSNDGIEFPEHLKALGEVYKELERINPKRQGVFKKKAEFFRKEAEYVERWENSQRASGNPAVYDPDAPEHEAFYKKHDVPVDADELDDAKFELRYRSRKDRDVDPELKSVKKTLAAMRAEPEAAAAVNQFGSSILKGLNPDFKGTKEDFEAWRAEHVIEDEIATEAHRELAPVVKSASMLWDGVEDFDKSNPAHVQASNLFAQMEQELAAHEEPIANGQGQTWVPAAQFERMSAQQKATHFTTTKQNLVNYIAITASNYVKKVAAERKQFAETYAKKLGYIKNDASKVTQQPPATTQVKTQQTPASPSVSSGGATPPSAGMIKSDKGGSISGTAAMLGLS